MSRKMIVLSNKADLLSLCSHLVCCGVPTFASLLSLLSTASLTGSLAVTELTQWAERWHGAAFAFSTVMVLVAIGSYYAARKRDCVQEGHCAHEPCAPKKMNSGRMLAVSLCLYALNVLVFLHG